MEQQGQIIRQSNFSVSLSNVFIYGMVIPSILLYHGLERAKFIYFLPLVFVSLVAVKSLTGGKEREIQKISIERNLVFSFLLYIIIASLSLAVSTQIYDEAVIIRDLIIISSPLIIFSFCMEFKLFHAKALFVAWVASYVLWVGGALLDWKGSLNILTSNYNTNAEFHNGVVFGLFFIVFLLSRSWLWAFLAFFIIILSGKRSIFLGLIPGLLVGFIAEFLVPKSSHPSFRFIFLGLVYLVCLSGGFFLIELSELFIKYFDSKGTLTVHKFLMGREIFVEGLKSKFFDSNILEILFGHGPGQADAFIREEVKPDWGISGKPVNPHNDYSKILFDYGLFGALGFFSILYSFYVKNRLGVYLLAYTWGAFFVDNSLIFIYYLLTAGILARIKL